MAWDSSRPVPWARLVREWLIYAVIMTVVFLIFFRGSNVVGAIAGVLISGPLYVVIGAIMAKFGYQRARLKDLRAQSAAAASAEPARGDTATRAKPAPTSRTGGGGSRPSSKPRPKGRR